MIALDTMEAASAMQAETRGAPTAFRGVTTDSRAVTGTPLFVALPGVNFDGHEFAGQAFEAGATALLVQRWLDLEAPQIRADSTVAALGRLAAHWRSRHDLPVVGVTGSNGKTTVKSMLDSILALAGPTLVNQGNFNNELGLPLTLCRLSSQHRHAVLEMGAARPGDIRYLAQIARPDLGIVNNAGPAHLEGMGDIEGVARTKGELIEALPENGIAIFNGDDDHASLWKKLAGARTSIQFGLQPANDVSATWTSTETGSDLVLRADQGTVKVRLSCFGQHNVSNALAAAAAALALDLSLDMVTRGLERFRPMDDRLSPRTMPGGWRLLSDSYNANPASVSAGLRVLASFGGERWLVLGDMRELGPDADALHFQVGAEARRMGIERLFCLGSRTRHCADGFGDASAHFDSLESLLDALRADLKSEVTCLVKGSRSMRMERVSQALEAD